jgi:hypothetical protein
LSSAVRQVTASGRGSTHGGVGCRDDGPPDELRIRLLIPLMVLATWDRLLALGTDEQLESLEKLLLAPC